MTGKQEFTAEQVTELLSELDCRLRSKGAAGAIFVVGGAAIAATGVRRDRMTADVDAMTHDEVVLCEAREMARERALPEDWLNSRVRMWLPSILPASALTRPTEPGLKVTYADDGFLLATKLVAQRAKDAQDIIALADRLGMSRATPEMLEAHIRGYYGDTAMLEFIVNGNDVDSEISALARDAAGLLNRVATARDSAL